MPGMSAPCCQKTPERMLCQPITTTHASASTTVFAGKRRGGARCNYQRANKNPTAAETALKPTKLSGTPRHYCRRKPSSPKKPALVRVLVPTCLCRGSRHHHLSPKALAAPLQGFIVDCGTLLPIRGLGGAHDAVQRIPSVRTWFASSL